MITYIPEKFLQSAVLCCKKPRKAPKTKNIGNMVPIMHSVYNLEESSAVGRVGRMPQTLPAKIQNFESSLLSFTNELIPIAYSCCVSHLPIVFTEQSPALCCKHWVEKEFQDESYMKYRRKMRQYVGGLRRAMRLMIFTLLLLVCRVDL